MRVERVAAVRVEVVAAVRVEVVAAVRVWVVWLGCGGAGVGFFVPNGQLRPGFMPGTI